MTGRWNLLKLCIAGCFAAAACYATPATLTLQITASGTVTPTGSQTPFPFTNTTFTAALNIDTSQVTTTNSGISFPTVTGGAFTMNGMTGTVQSSVGLDLSPPNVDFVLINGSGSTVILSASYTNLAGFSLLSSFGPVALTGVQVGTNPPTIQTSLGNITITGVSAVTFTFSLAPIISVAEGPTKSFAIISTGALETSWTQTGSFSNVSIAAPLANGPDQIYLTNSIGPSATQQNVIASVTLPITGQTSGAASLTPLFTGLNLGPGTYYLVVQGGDWDIVDGGQTTTLAPGVTLGSTNFAPTPMSFAPGSTFSEAETTAPFLKISVTGVSDPVFSTEVPLGGGVYYMAFPDQIVFGYYTFVAGNVFYHYDMGYEAFVPGSSADVYLYDFTSGHWWYTSSTLFPYLYDFTLNTWIYYFPNTTSPGHYTTNPRYFSNLTSGQIITM